MSAVRNDFDAAVHEYRSLFSERRVTGNPTRYGRGRNFMTPDVLGYVNASGETVEVSTGMFMEHRIYGATWPRRSDGSPDDRSDVFHTLDALFDALYGGAG